MSIKLCLLLLNAVFVDRTFGLKCYICGFSSTDTDRSCLTVTEDTRTVDCTYKYCTVFRQEYVDPFGQVSSFERNCIDTPVFLNHEITDSTFRTFYRACTTDLCNIGNGIQSVVGGTLSPTPIIEGQNLLVPGTAPDGASTLRNCFIITIIAIFTLNILT